MIKYLKAFAEILINYNFYSIPILIFEIFFHIKYPNKYNNLYPDALWAQLGIYFEKFKHYTP